MEFKGSKTEENLWKAFAGESMARNKYDYFASKAKKEGFEQIAGFFEETALNEKEHAKLWFKYLMEGDIPTTAENLLAAAEGELEEFSQMYPSMEEVAREEGFTDIANIFARIAEVEAVHEARYRKLLDGLKRETLFKRPAPVKWKCRNCGYVLESKIAPAKCPACAHPQAFFEEKSENY